MNVRHAVSALAAAVVLAGCAGGTRAAPATPGTPDSAPTAPTATAPIASSPAAQSPAPSKPAAAATPHGTLLVADFGADTVTFVDPDPGHDRRTLGSVEVGTAPYGLVVDDKGTAWVATAEGVAVVDTATRTRLARIPYETRTGPVTTGEYRGGGMGIALAPDGRHVYVGVNVPGRNGVLEIIDTATRKVTDTVPVGRRPFDVDVSPDGTEGFTRDGYGNGITVVDLTGRKRPFELAAGARPLGIAIL